MAQGHLSYGGLSGHQRGTDAHADGFEQLGIQLLSWQGYAKEHVEVVDAASFTNDWVRRTGLQLPSLVRGCSTYVSFLQPLLQDMRDLELLSKELGDDREVQTLDVAKQAPGPKWTMRQWCLYWKERITTPPYCIEQLLGGSGRKHSTTPSPAPGGAVTGCTGAAGGAAQVLVGSDAGAGDAVLGSAAAADGVVSSHTEGVSTEMADEADSAFVHQGDVDQFRETSAPRKGIRESTKRRLMALTSVALFDTPAAASSLAAPALRVPPPLAAADLVFHLGLTREVAAGGTAVGGGGGNWEAPPAVARQHLAVWPAGAARNFRLLPGGAASWWAVAQGHLVFLLVSPSDQALALFASWIATGARDHGLPLLDAWSRHPLPPRPLSPAPPSSTLQPAPPPQTLVTSASPPCDATAASTHHTLPTGGVHHSPSDPSLSPTTTTGRIIRLDASAGDLAILPSGWPFAVVAVSDSAAVCGQLLHCHGLSGALHSCEVEELLGTRQRARYPMFKQIMWHAAVVYGRSLRLAAGLPMLRRSHAAASQDCGGTAQAPVGMTTSCKAYVGGSVRQTPPSQPQASVNIDSTLSGQGPAAVAAGPLWQGREAAAAQRSVGGVGTAAARGTCEVTGRKRTGGQKLDSPWRLSSGAGGSAVAVTDTAVTLHLRLPGHGHSDGGGSSSPLSLQYAGATIAAAGGRGNKRLHTNAGAAVRFFSHLGDRGEVDDIATATSPRKPERLAFQDPRHSGQGGGGSGGGGGRSTVGGAGLLCSQDTCTKPRVAGSARRMSTRAAAAEAKGGARGGVGGWDKWGPSMEDYDVEEGSQVWVPAFAKGGERAAGGRCGAEERTKRAVAVRASNWQQLLGSDDYEEWAEEVGVVDSGGSEGYWVKATAGGRVQPCPADCRRTDSDDADNQYDERCSMSSDDGFGSMRAPQPVQDSDSDGSEGVAPAVPGRAAACHPIASRDFGLRGEGPRRACPAALPEGPSKARRGAPVRQTTLSVDGGAVTSRRIQASFERMAELQGLADDTGQSARGGARQRLLTPGQILRDGLGLSENDVGDDGGGSGGSGVRALSACPRLRVYDDDNMFADEAARNRTEGSSLENGDGHGGGSENSGACGGGSEAVGAVGSGHEGPGTAGTTAQRPQRQRAATEAGVGDSPSSEAHEARQQHHQTQQKQRWVWQKWRRRAQHVVKGGGDGLVAGSGSEGSAAAAPAVPHRIAVQPVGGSAAASAPTRQPPQPVSRGPHWAALSKDEEPQQIQKPRHGNQHPTAVTLACGGHVPALAPPHSALPLVTIAAAGPAVTLPCPPPALRPPATPPHPHLNSESLAEVEAPARYHIGPHGTARQGHMTARPRTIVGGGRGSNGGATPPAHPFKIKLHLSRRSGCGGTPGTATGPLMTPLCSTVDLSRLPPLPAVAAAGCASGPCTAPAGGGDGTPSVTLPSGPTGVMVAADSTGFGGAAWLGTGAGSAGGPEGAAGAGLKLRLKLPVTAGAGAWTVPAMGPHEATAMALLSPLGGVGLHRQGPQPHLGALPQTSAPLGPAPSVPALPCTCPAPLPHITPVVDELASLPPQAPGPSLPTTPATVTCTPPPAAVIYHCVSNDEAEETVPTDGTVVPADALQIPQLDGCGDDVDDDDGYNASVPAGLWLQSLPRLVGDLGSAPCKELGAASSGGDDGGGQRKVSLGAVKHCGAGVGGGAAAELPSRGSEPMPLDVHARDDIANAGSGGGDTLPSFDSALPHTPTSLLPAAAPYQPRTVVLGSLRVAPLSQQPVAQRLAHPYSHAYQQLQQKQQLTPQQQPLVHGHLSILQNLSAKGATSAGAAPAATVLHSPAATLALQFPGVKQPPLRTPPLHPAPPRLLTEALHDTIISHHAQPLTALSLGTQMAVAGQQTLPQAGELLLVPPLLLSTDASALHRENGCGQLEEFQTRPHLGPCALAPAPAASSQPQRPQQHIGTVSLMASVSAPQTAAHGVAGFPQQRRGVLSSGASAAFILAYPTAPGTEATADQLRAPGAAAAAAYGGPTNPVGAGAGASSDDRATAESHSPLPQAHAVAITAAAALPAPAAGRSSGGPSDPTVQSTVRGSVKRAAPEGPIQRGRPAAMTPTCRGADAGVRPPATLRPLKSISDAVPDVQKALGLFPLGAAHRAGQQPPRGPHGGPLTRMMPGRPGQQQRPPAGLLAAAAAASRQSPHGDPVGGPTQPPLRPAPWLTYGRLASVAGVDSVAGAADGHQGAARPTASSSLSQSHGWGIQKMQTAAGLTLAAQAFVGVAHDGSGNVRGGRGEGKDGLQALHAAALRVGTHSGSSSPSSPPTSPSTGDQMPTPETAPKPKQLAVLTAIAGTLQRCGMPPPPTLMPATIVTTLATTAAAAQLLPATAAGAASSSTQQLPIARHRPCLDQLLSPWEIRDLPQLISTLRRSLVNSPFHDDVPLTIREPEGVLEQLEEALVALGHPVYDTIPGVARHLRLVQHNHQENLLVPGVPPAEDKGLVPITSVGAETGTGAAKDITGMGDTAPSAVPTLAAGGGGAVSGGGSLAGPMEPSPEPSGLLHRAGLMVQAPPCIEAPAPAPSSLAVAGKRLVPPLAHQQPSPDQPPALALPHASTFGPKTAVIFAPCGEPLKPYLSPPSMTVRFATDAELPATWQMLRERLAEQRAHSPGLGRTAVELGTTLEDTVEQTAETDPANAGVGGAAGPGGTSMRPPRRVVRGGGLVRPLSKKLAKLKKGLGL